MPLKYLERENSLISKMFTEGETLKMIKIPVYDGNAFVNGEEYEEGDDFYISEGVAFPSVKRRSYAMEDIVNRFKNGKERFQTSAVFNIVVQQLARGADPYEIIDQLISANESVQKSFSDYIDGDTRPYVRS